MSACLVDIANDCSNMSKLTRSGRSWCRQGCSIDAGMCSVVGRMPHRHQRSGNGVPGHQGDGRDRRHCGKQPECSGRSADRFAKKTFWCIVAAELMTGFEGPWSKKRRSSELSGEWRRLCTNWSAKYYEEPHHSMSGNSLKEIKGD